MKYIFAFSISIFCFFGFMQQGSLALSISGNGTLGSFTGDISYDPTNAKLYVELTNTSPVANGGYLTAFAFNNPFDSITAVSLSSTDSDFLLLGGSSFDNSIGAMPYGDFDIGASLSNNGNNPFQGGGNPQKGIGVNMTEFFTFAFTGTDLSNLISQDFLEELSAGSATDKSPTFFVARFRGFDDGGSNKIPASLVPEPATIALLGIGLAGLAGAEVRRRRKKKAVAKI